MKIKNKWSKSLTEYPLALVRYRVELERQL